MKFHVKVVPDAMNQELYRNLALTAVLKTESSQGLTWVTHIKAAELGLVIVKPGKAAAQQVRIIF